MTSVSASPAAGRHPGKSESDENLPPAGEVSPTSPQQGTEETPFVPPDEDLQQRIIKQVEFYFSDANIQKDAFLMKHVKRNPQGFVSLRLISSFKKMKSLSKDFRNVVHALRRSEKLELNPEGTKVRRVAPLPDGWDALTHVKTVLALNLPARLQTIEAIAEEATSARQLRRPQQTARAAHTGSRPPRAARASFERGRCQRPASA